MASLDIVSKIDSQTLDNAINSAKRELQNRYDFKGSTASIELDKKSFILYLHAETDMKMDQLETMVINALVKNKIDPTSMDFGKEKYAAGKTIKKDILIKQGIDKETAKKIVKSIKGTKLKVQPTVMDEQVRVAAKKIDDLQAVIAHCRKESFGVPLQFINFK